MKKISWIDIVTRIIMFIPVLTIITIFSIKWWCVLMFNFIRYGGETMIYNSGMNKHSIGELLHELKKSQDKE